MLTWKDIQVIIPTNSSDNFRSNNCKKLAYNISKECIGCNLEIAKQYNIKTFRDVFISISNALKSINKEYILYIEDDVCLSNDFGKRALNRINYLNKDIISFFSIGGEDIVRYNSGIRSYEKPGHSFGYLQCIFMTKEIGIGWGNMMVNWWDSAQNNLKGAPDFALGEYCQKHDILITISLPSLVQHISTTSLFGHICVKSKTFGFEDI